MRSTESRERCSLAVPWLKLAFVITALAMPAYAQQPARNASGNAPPQGASASASGSAGQTPPDTPAPSSSTSAAQSPPVAGSTEGQQTRRILGVIPNFRAVSVDMQLPPQSPKEKFVGFAQDSFDYSAFVWIGALAGISQIKNSTPEFGQGTAGFGRYYWHAFADQTNENLWVGFLLPVAARQDPRYYTLGKETVNGHNSLFKRTGYAVSRLLVTRSDSGRDTFNISEVGGAGAAAAISNLYYPGPEKTWTKTYQRWGLNLGLDGITDVFREFWPDINHAIFHGK